MLRTNSKKARENIREYIINNFTPDNYGKTCEDFENFSEIAKFILDTFRSEKKYIRCVSEVEKFFDWCSGLPSIIDTCYFYNRSAVSDLGNILEESESERSKFTEQQAEKTLTALIYRELLKG